MVNGRDRDTILLLGSLPDAPFAQPKSWTSELVRKNAKRGEVPAHRVPCPACNGQKRRRVRTVLQPCDRCVGARGKPLGYIVVDGMIFERFRRQIGTMETKAPIEFKTVPCDTCGGRGRTLAPRWRGDGDLCLRCNGGGVLEVLKSAWLASRSVTVELELRAPIGDAVISAMEARERAGSYDELVSALAELHEEWPALYRLVVDRYVRGEELHDERLERLALEGGVAFLSARMPDPIRVPGSVRRREQEAA